VSSGLTLQDLEDVLMALRGQAFIARQDAVRNRGSSSEAQFTHEAERLDALAARFERAIEGSRGTKG
jgi:hypothetical protein